MQPTQVVVDVGGVGLQISIPLSSYERLPAVGERVHLLTLLLMREDSMQLFGFITAEERELFSLLIQRIANVGPKTALNILSGMSVGEFRSAVLAGDVGRLSRLHGVGKRTAERIIVELKDLMRDWGGEVEVDGVVEPSAGSAVSDAVMALVSLGFKQADAQRAVRAVAGKLGDGANVEALIRAALQSLT